MIEDPAPFLSDGELAAAALRDKQAYAFVVRRWEAPLGRYVSRLVGRSKGLAEDILQEVFLKAYLNLNDYDQSRPFAPWIYRIARNQAIDALRRQKGEPVFVTGEDAAVIFERLVGEVEPQETFDRIRTEEKVRLAIGTLDPRYREVMLLRYLEEKEYEEISDILEVPPGTVATLIRRGTQRLRSALEALGLGVTLRGPA